MNGRLGTYLLLLLAGCQTKNYYTPPPEQLPAPVDRNGLRVSIEDARPEWERQPFVGSVSLYHPAKAKPNPWAQIESEAEAAAAAMPARPERVEVVVSSLRLVKRAPPPRRADPSENVPVGGSSDLMSGRKGKQGNSERARAEEMPRATAPEPRAGALDEMGPAALDGHPGGASCWLRARVKLVFPGGREQVVEVKAIAVGDRHGAGDWDAALDFAAKMAVEQFRTQLRQGVGLQPGG